MDLEFCLQTPLTEEFDGLKQEGFTYTFIDGIRRPAQWTSIVTDIHAKNLVSEFHKKQK